MSDDQDPNRWAAPPPSVPSEWAPPYSSSPSPSSSLPAPPPAHVSAEPAPASISTGPVVAAVSKKPSWVGRAVALGLAAMLVGGGGYLAINAGNNDDGADSPQAALAGAFAALADEDLIGAAEFVEPLERETIVDAGFDLVNELIRLEVLDSSLDLNAVEGIDFDITYADLRVVPIAPDLAQVYVDNGTITSSVDGAAAPLGALITDRVDEQDLAVKESSTTDLPEHGTPIVAVMRDGRWFLSLWYTVAENARLSAGEPLPDPADRVTALGGDTPERTIENLVAALALGDLSTSIGMLDPEETGALYDYAPLFLSDAQDTVDRALDDLRDQGWSWEVTALELDSQISGSTATVSLEEFAFAASSQSGGTLDLQFTPTTMNVYFEDGTNRLELETVDGCTTMTFEDRYSRDSQTFCQDDLLGEMGLGSLASSGLYGVQAGTLEMVVREVDGRWYLSPIRTGSNAMFQVLENLEPDTVADTVDAIVELMADPYALQESFGVIESEPLAVEEMPAFDPPAEVVLPQSDLLPEVLGRADWLYEIDDTDNSTWTEWLSGATITEFDRGIVAGATLPNDLYFEVVVIEGLSVETDQELAEFLAGELTEYGGYTLVEGQSDVGAFVAARYKDGLVLIGDYDASVLSSSAAPVLVDILES